MKLEDAIRKFTSIKNGTYQHFEFNTDVPVKAKYKNEISIKKHTFTVARFGINYGKIKKNNSNNKIKKNNNKYWILKNVIEYNKNTDKFYVNAYKSPNKPNSVYVVYNNGNVIGFYNSKDDIREYVIDSYFRNNDSPIYKVCLDNVINVGN